MRAITTATPAQIEAFRAAMRARSGKRTRKRAPEPMLVRGCFLSHGDGFELQAPVHLPRALAHDSIMKQVKQRLIIKTRNTVGAELVSQCKNIDRARIESFTLTRIAPQKMAAWDNLRTVMKPVLDVTCRWIVEGAAMLDSNGRVITTRIGDFDDLLHDTGRCSWDYDQLTHEQDRRLYGIRIRFRLRPRS